MRVISSPVFIYHFYADKPTLVFPQISLGKGTFTLLICMAHKCTEPPFSSPQLVPSYLSYLNKIHYFQSNLYDLRIFFLDCSFSGSHHNYLCIRRFKKILFILIFILNHLNQKINMNLLIKVFCLPSKYPPAHHVYFSHRIFLKSKSDHFA